MKTADKELTIRDLQDTFLSDVPKEIIDDFFLSRIVLDEKVPVLCDPCRFNCGIVYFCTKGHFKVDFNLRVMEIREGSLMLCSPGNIVHFCNFEDMAGSECVLLGISRRFMNGLRFDFARFYDESMMTIANPCIELDLQERSVCLKFYELAQNLIALKPAYLKDSLVSLASSIFYYFAHLWSCRLKGYTEASKSPIRAKMVFENFLKLVQENHLEQRNVSYYADKLCLSSKYLSQLVRKVSGQSAPHWIDAFIIMKAKNLLRYSDMDIKEIVFKLNFRSQAIFSRFFKAHTGQTPMEYRKSL